MAVYEHYAMSKSFGTAALKRSHIYRFFSIAFRYPGLDVAGELREKENLDLLEEVKEIYSVLPVLSGTIDALKKAITSVGDIMELQVEYTRMFIGPFHLPAPPYESIYRAESRGKAMGDSTLRVKAKYLDEGLYLTDSVHDLPDHIIAELEFMSYLSKQEAFLWENETDRGTIRSYLQRQEAFLGDHLTKWIPQFTAAVSRETKEELYRLLARLVEAVVFLDYDYVRALIHSQNYTGNRE